MKDDRNHEHELEQDPRLTAYVLGELDAEQRAEVEALLQRDADASRLVSELRQAASAFEGVLGAPADLDEQQLRLLPEQRQRIAAAGSSAGSSATSPAAGTAAGGARAPWRRWSIVGPGILAAAAGLLVTANLLLESRFAPAAGDMQAARAPEPDATVARSTPPMEGEGGLPRSEQDGAPGAPMPTAPREAEAAIVEEAFEVEDLAQLESLGYAADSPFDSTIVNDAIGIGGGAGGRFGGRSGGRARRPSAPAREGLVGNRSRDRAEEVLDRDDEAPNREGYRPIFENDFQEAKASPLSTFAVDVDSASYANVRRILREGRMPPADAVRIEEFVNYFPYEDPTPAEGHPHPLLVSAETASAPWRPEHRLLRVAVTTRSIAAEERAPSNLVFLLDVSGSMDEPDKLLLLKRAFTLLVEQLDGRDRVSIVVYAGAAGVVLEPTTGDQQTRILAALERLDAGGATNGGAGIQLAYDLARANFLEEGTNRVILATDGDFNVGTSDDGSLVRLVQEEARSGVFLTLLGFGTGNLQDSKMEQIANRGNGTYGYVDSLLEARRLLVEQMGATLDTVAKDVKLQVEFNPNSVAGYRLLGYENRLLAAQDFADDTKDGGEMGAGHRMTALYEIVPAGRPLPGPEQPDLKYQGERLPTGDAFNGELCTVKVRYKQPAADTSVPYEVAVRDSGEGFEGAGADTRFAAAVASFAMLLRESAYAGDATLDDVLRQAREALGEDVGGYRHEFLELVERARALQAAGAGSDEER